MHEQHGWFTARRSVRRRLIGGFVAAGLLLAACASPTTRTAPDTANAPAPERPATPKTLRLGMTIEPANGFALFGSTGGSGWNYAYMFQAGLTVYDEKSTLQPRIAQKVPSIEAGDW
ncbi:MAG: hypothetical protein QOF51_1140, partial [Chloroflexota bacterium]|nr:hypothetical protein [Chloroflexota bacterium]